MAILGVRAAVDNVTPTGVDAIEVFEFTVLRNTMTAGELMRDTAAIIGQVNEDLAAEYSSIMTITDEMYAIMPQGEATRTMTPTATEYRDADAIRTDEVGSMLPLRKYDDATGWTAEYLLDASRTQITNDVTVISDRWRNRFDYEFASSITILSFRRCVVFVHVCVASTAASDVRPSSLRTKLRACKRSPLNFVVAS